LVKPTIHVLAPHTQITYHIGIYIRDTLFSRNPVECLIAKFLRSLNFAGCIPTRKYKLVCIVIKDTPETDYAPIERQQTYTWKNLRCEKRHGNRSSDFPVQFLYQRLSRIQSVWSSEEGENLVCKWEMSNPRDSYAVVCLKEEQTVGHLPRKISRLCSLFLGRGGGITATVTGKRQCWTRNPLSLDFLWSGRVDHQSEKNNGMQSSTLWKVIVFAQKRN
jgi:hypothetical protein